MKEHPHFENPKHERQEHLNNSSDNFMPQADRFKNSRDVVHAFIDGQITIEQLNEAIRRDSERIISTEDMHEEKIESKPGQTAEYSRYDIQDEQILEQELNDKIVRDHILGISGSRGAFCNFIRKQTSTFQRTCGVRPKNQRK